MLRQWGTVKAMDFKKLWTLLLLRRIRKEKLRIGAKVSSATLAKMGRGEPVSETVLTKICAFLGCTVDDIVEVDSCEVDGNANAMGNNSPTR